MTNDVTQRARLGQFSLDADDYRVPMPYPHGPNNKRSRESWPRSEPRFPPKKETTTEIEINSR
jgi:hypothetical protein